MHEGKTTPEALLQEAERLAAAGKKNEARELIAEALRLDDKSISAWALLARFANSTTEEIFCLKRVVHLDPQIAPVASQPYLTSPASTQVEPVVANDDRCQRLIENALQASDQGCTRMAPNQVCYGNTTVSAQLAPGAPSRFEQRGDIINIDRLLSISVSPLDPAKDEWGIAVFKLLANLPRTLPGQNVTFIVFGNTSLTNASGNMQAFYFSSAGPYLSDNEEVVIGQNVTFSVELILESGF